MRNLSKYSLALQVAIAGVALAQVQSDPAVRDPGTARPAAPAGRTDQMSQPGTIDDRSGMQVKDTSQRDKMTPAGTMRASKLIGAEVYNQQGKHLGEVNDIVLDKGNKKVGYVVLSYGGIAGLGDKLFALPRNAVQIAPESSPTGQTKAIVALDEQTLKNAPGFDKNKWPTEANADYYRNLDQYYRQHGGDRLTQGAERVYDRTSGVGQKPADEAARQAGAKIDQSKEKLSDSMKRDTTGAQPAAAQMGDEGGLTWSHRVSELIGADVKSPQDENLGEIHDLVIDWPGGQVRYAVLSYGGILGLGDKLFAVPMDKIQTRDDDLVLSVDKQQLKNAPGFNKDQWPDVADPKWSKSVDEFYRQGGGGSQSDAGQRGLTR